MKLKNLRLRWSELSESYEGSVSFDGKHSTIELKLGPEASSAVLKTCGGLLVKEATALSRALVQEAAEAAEAAKASPNN